MGSGLQRASAVALLVGLVIGAAWLAPARLLGHWVQQGSNGAVRLAGVSGTLWSGSAQVQFHPERLGGDDQARPQPPIVLPGRVSWNTGWSWRGGLLLRLQSPQLSGPVAEQPMEVQQWWTARPVVWVPDGALRLPHMNLRHATGPLALFRPEFKAALQWSGLKSNDLAALRLTLTLEDLGSALSPIRPLGSYRVALAPEGEAARTWTWRLESLGDPVIVLTGQGRLDPMLRGRLALQCMRSCEFVGGILSAVGKKNGEVYEAQFGL